jgi:hypothetical protein
MTASAGQQSYGITNFSQYRFRQPLAPANRPAPGKKISGQEDSAIFLP